MRLGRGLGAIFAAGWLALMPAPSPAADLAKAEIPHAREALKLAQAGKWSAARAQAAKVKSPLFGKIVTWLDLISHDSGDSFEDVAAFLDANPQWPSRHTLARRAEEAMTAATPDEAVLAWFAQRRPLTPDGRSRLAAALYAKGKDAEADALVRESWINDTFGDRQERQFLARHRDRLTPADHWARLDRLLWDDKIEPARRMLPFVSHERRLLAEARITLIQRTGGIDKVIARVPEDLQGDPGLIYDRLRWNRAKGFDMTARQILDPGPPNLGRPEKWYRERAIMARRALQLGHISEAYRLAARHHLKDGAEFAGAEWLAGWIALRFLNEPATGLNHFKAMYNVVSYPVSRARAAYWAGRAAEATGNRDEAEGWYKTAAQYPTVYYGQLAEAKVNPTRGSALPAIVEPSAEERTAFNAHELTRAVRLLKDLDAKREHLRPFLLALDGVDKRPGWRTLTAALADGIGRPDIAVFVARRAVRENNEFLATGYPLVGVPHGSPESPLVHAVVRQESAFDPAAKSAANALGLMQLLPSTASGVAKKLGVKFSKDKLTGDPNFNLKVGRAYLQGLLDDFAGSYVLALASYNAGPNRARAWIREYGDPRDSSIDVVDWVESIPYEETRNYVQRVMEDLQVYRRRLETTEVAMNLERDLKR